MNPVQFLFYIARDWVGTDPEQIGAMMEKAENDYNQSKVKSMLDRYPYILFILPILAPILKIYFDRAMQKLIQDADGDGDEDMYDLLLQMVGKMAKKRPASELAKQFQNIQFGGHD